MEREKTGEEGEGKSGTGRKEGKEEKRARMSGKDREIRTGEIIEMGANWYYLRKVRVVSVLM